MIIKRSEILTPKQAITASFEGGILCEKRSFLMSRGILSHGSWDNPPRIPPRCWEWVFIYSMISGNYIGGLSYNRGSSVYLLYFDPIFDFQGVF